MAQKKNIFRDLANVERRLTRLEMVKQPIGADIVQITSSSLGSATSGSVSAGGRVTFTTTLTPSAEILNLWDLFFSFYIDTNGNSAYLYPSGSSLTDAQKDLDLQWSLDWATSDDNIGKRVGKITIINNDSSSHEYFINTKWYGIKQTL